MPRIARPLSICLPLSACLLLTACDSGTDNSTAPIAGRNTEKTFGEPVANAISKLEADLEPALTRMAQLTGQVDNATGGSNQAPDTIDTSALRDLLSLARDDEGMRKLAFQDLAGLGSKDEVLSELHKLVMSCESEAAPDWSLATTAVEALGQWNDPVAAQTLLMVLNGTFPGSLKAYAAYALQLGEQTWVVPRLTRRLRYETDRETWVWMTKTMIKFGNFSGLPGLADIAATEEDPELREMANTAQWELAEQFGFESPQELLWHWNLGNVDGRLPAELTSEHQKLIIWRFVRDLGSFQLRPVDDSRLALSNLGEHAAHILADALADNDPHIRLHSAQTLGRMGPRAAVAGSSLVELLGDQQTGQEAARALGSIGYPAGEAALIACLTSDNAPELRVASARALGSMGLSSSALALQAELQAKGAAKTQLPELRVALAGALLRTSPLEPSPEVRSALGLLAECMSGTGIGAYMDPHLAQVDLDAWVLRAKASEQAWTQALTSAWSEAGANAATDQAGHDTGSVQRSQVVLNWLANNP